MVCHFQTLNFFLHLSRYIPTNLSPPLKFNQICNISLDYEKTFCKINFSNMTTTYTTNNDDIVTKIVFLISLLTVTGNERNENTNDK